MELSATFVARMTLVIRVIKVIRVIRVIRVVRVVRIIRIIKSRPLPFLRYLHYQPPPSSASPKFV